MKRMFVDNEDTSGNFSGFKWLIPWKREAVLVLEDGSVYKGYGFGSVGRKGGEVVFSTSMVGYTEAFTDPSYNGQILMLTYPLVGNYGVPSYDRKDEYGLPLNFESSSIKIEGLVVHEACFTPSHWASVKTLEDWLVEEGVPGIWGIDTRSLTIKLRERGVMLGIIESFKPGEKPEVEKLVEDVKRVEDPNKKDLVGEVALLEEKVYEPKIKARGKVVLIDCGVKNNIIRCELRQGYRVIRVPYDTPFERIEEHDPDGVIISNGPGDPERCAQTIEVVKEVLEAGIPTLGICLGNQIIALAEDARCYKMKFGHRSVNKPCIERFSNRCFVTTQNHGFAVNPDSLPGDLEIWWTNADDKTVEGIFHEEKPCFAVQFHPEHDPGPRDTEFIFEIFTRMIKERKPLKKMMR